MYHMIGERIIKEFMIELSQLMSWMKRTVASQNSESGDILDEGKKSMSYEVYKKLCMLIFRGEGDDYTFAHVFLVLD